jgi:outer membrane protein assembly factor BamB
MKTKLTNPIVHDGHVYTLSDGYLECTEIDSFERLWKQRGRFGNGQIFLVGDKLLVHSETGTLHLVLATPQGYEELGTIKTIGGICWNTIALSGNLILLRSEREAACFRLPEEPQ